MRRLFRILFTVALCAAVSNPQMEARGRNNNGGNNSETPQRQHENPRSKRSETHNGNSNRPNGNNSRPNGSNGLPNGSNGLPNGSNGLPNGNNSRPNGNNSRPNGNNSRPNGSNGLPNGNNSRPNGNNSRPNGNNSRPNGNNSRPSGSNSRPWNNGQHPGSHPASPAPGKPGLGIQPPVHNQMRPSNIHNVPHHAPHRPMLPAPVHYCPPIPPAQFRPTPTAPRFATILGIALGSAITYTIQELINTGYNVCGYTNNAVYVNDASMLNMVWPNSTLFYNNGRLSGSEFVYSTQYYDTARYYSAYNSLLRNYGAPVSTSTLPGGGMNASWFGYDGRYVTLQYTGATAEDGIFRYYTTLSFGC